MWNVIVEYFPDWKTWNQALATLLFALIIKAIYGHLYTWGKNKGSNEEQNEEQSQEEQEKASLTGNYDTDLEAIKQMIGGNSDVNFRDFRISLRSSRAVLIYVEGMEDKTLLNMQVLQNLMDSSFQKAEGYSLQGEDFTSYVKERLLPVSKLNEIKEINELGQFVLRGFTALLIEGLQSALLIGEPTPKVRSIDEPTSEALLRGPRIGFTEVLSENTALLRQHGRSSDLEMKMVEVGSRIKRNMVIAYMKEIVNQDLLKEVNDRVATVKMDFIAESGYVEQLIEDDWLSPFQQVQNTERPDRVINALLEGRIALLLDGTPFALIVPVTFSMLLQSPEDYYERWLSSSLLRTLRFIVAFTALMMPAMYISFISFHPGLIPTELAVTIIETRQAVPFPSIIEVLILEISIEILREAGIRLPKPIGPAMGIVGGLIIGDAAVQAGIVSPILVIAVAVTAISSFAIPMYSAGITLRMLRFVGMFFAAMLGMYGTILFFLLICSHLTRLKSFGVPYVTPIAPYRLNDWKDLFLRLPITLMKHRPNLLKAQQKKRRP
ncbi:spore germination protein [Paenibacillus septentrionalis]|uniref:Spore germination protein n=1 Tax=Paenibacillus septentrionalis TaxID=429342 RepID=A0ABW1V072_9BACL